MRITGTLHSIGTIHECGDETIKGILITADDDTLRAASNLLCATVDIYPHPVNGLVAGECTPENYAHALARLTHAEDNLAREVRSSQALMVVHDGLRLMNDGYHTEVQDLRAEVKRLRCVLHKHNISADTSGEECDPTVRDAAWAKYLDLRKQIRTLADEGRTDSEEQHTLVARALDLARLHNFDPPTRELEKLQAEHDALAGIAHDLRIKLVTADYIAGKACQALAELSSVYDDAGGEAQAIMCEWDTSGDSAGEHAARRVVDQFT